MNTVNVVLTVLSLLIAIIIPLIAGGLGYLIKVLGQLEAHKGKFDLVEERINYIRVGITDLKDDLIKLEIRFDKEAEVAMKILHKFNPSDEWQQKLDKLLEKLQARNITTVELAELITKLNELKEDEEVPDGKRFVAGKVLGYIESRYVRADLIK